MDLHMHTNASLDGEFSPNDLMNRILKTSLKVVAVADHNTTESVEEMIKLGNQHDIHVIPAIELDCFYQETPLHILGYGINPNNEAIINNDNFVKNLLVNNSLTQLELIEKTGIIVDREKVWNMSKDNIVVPEDVAEVVLADPRNNDHPLLVNFRQGGSRSDNPFVNFYWDICAHGKPAYVHTEYVSLKEAIYMIHNAGGIATFAHPANNIGMNKELALSIYNEGLQGIEVYSSYHTTKETQFYKSLAEELNCIMTVGSDFHGHIKPSIQLGGVEVDNEQDLLDQFIHALTN